MSAETICRRLVISGRVQGVAYRVSMVDAAMRLGVRGWVRNRSNGDVEATVQGTPEAVEAIIEWARRGPSLAVVDNVQIEDAPVESFRRFETRSTY
ncbi:MAG TPA: acylphosphatase [Burkholderiales bacterium]|nr:acylphosphatase [Burkholderiales bacterium]